MLEIITLELLYAVAWLVAADCEASEVGDLLKASGGWIEGRSNVQGLVLFANIFFLIVHVVLVNGVLVFILFGRKSLLADFLLDRTVLGMRAGDLGRWASGCS
jgi:uncharacterized membrane protein YhdT